MKMVRFALWIVVALVLVGVGSRFFLQNDGPALTSGPGGNFTLTSHTGEVVSNTDFDNQYMLIYFGYSFCPDVCPLDLQKMSVALYQLEEEGYDTTPIQPIFITIDPERDTVEELASFMPDFHPRLIGLTGTPAEIADVARKYKVYYAKREQPGTDSYLMDHQAYQFVMGPGGEFLRIFSSRDKPQDIAAAFGSILEKR
ncbi:SCO family protein [Kordiimonas aquimaris]|uniref:SCO family protein n=1 Tax=Kordiimonas aquimaris TaxID=707591 RepID=UPI0021D21D50|nr:SCO family protein [Kordiimonas aquimaris]